MLTLLKKAKNKLVNLIENKNDHNLDREYKEYLKTGRTSNEAYQKLISLYCSTNGQFNEDFNQKITESNPAKKKISAQSQLLGNYDLEDFAHIDSVLKEDGYYVFQDRLSKDLCAELYNFALNSNCVIPNSEQQTTYNPSKLISEIYRLDAQDLINNPIVQNLITDPVLTNIVRNYLGCEPIFDYPAMWWSTSFLKEASSDAAQFYHFDMDRVKWLKIFFYINDVTEENGPHWYISKTHKIGAKPEHLLKRGYVRIKDEELEPLYPSSDIKVIKGNAGSIFIGDTKCWHKGSALKGGHRLVLELNYTSSLFGANYSKLEVSHCTDQFKAYCLENKMFADNIVFQNKNAEQ